MSVLEHKELAGHWETLIKERTESGMTIKEWCHQHGIKESKYYYWSRTLRTDAAGSVQPGMPFVELPAVCQEQREHRGVAFICRGNVSIEITEDATVDFIAKVMEAVSDAR